MIIVLSLLHYDNIYRTTSIYHVNTIFTFNFTLARISQIQYMRKQFKQEIVNAMQYLY